MRGGSTGSRATSITTVWLLFVVCYHTNCPGSDSVAGQTGQIPRNLFSLAEIFPADDNSVGVALGTQRPTHQLHLLRIAGSVDIL
jgi:hypothetical protein